MREGAEFFPAPSLLLAMNKEEEAVQWGRLLLLGPY